jgi:hypothetical protein
VTVICENDVEITKKHKSHYNILNLPLWFSAEPKKMESAMLDMKTIVFDYFTSSALITVVMAILWRQNRNRFRGLFFRLVDCIPQVSGLLLL